MPSGSSQSVNHTCAPRVELCTAAVGRAGKQEGTDLEERMELCECGNRPGHTVVRPVIEGHGRGHGSMHGVVKVHHLGARAGLGGLWGQARARKARDLRQLPRVKVLVIKGIV